MTRKAFTLVELFVVVSIIAILAAIVIPNVIEYRTDDTPPTHHLLVGENVIIKETEQVGKVTGYVREHFNDIYTVRLYSDTRGEFYTADFIEDEIVYKKKEK